MNDRDDIFHKKIEKDTKKNLGQLTSGFSLETLVRIPERTLGEVGEGPLVGALEGRVGSSGVVVQMW